MHEGQVAISADLAAQLMREQFPQYADLRIQSVQNGGTENAVFRLAAMWEEALAAPPWGGPPA